MSLHPLTQQAGALIELGRYEDAKSLLARRLAEDPGEVRAWTRLARCHMNAGEHEEALAALDEALKAAPEDLDAVDLRARVLRRLKRRDESEQAAREAIRIDPQWWGAYALLAELLCFPPSPDTWGEGVSMAEEAVRLAPEEVGAYETLWKIAVVARNDEAADALERHILALDPTHELALSQQTARAAKTPGVKAAQAADLYADALAAVPGSSSLSRGLDQATYRLLRGIRWLALICLLLAGAMVNLFPADGEAPELPVPLATRVWVLVLMTAVWAFGAWRRYRRLRAGVRLNVRSLVRRGFWARIVLAQAAWAMLCALLIAQVPWTDRLIPQILFWAGMAPIAATVWFDRKKRR
ncbi:tetratricopeptide repeat protein [Streptomyces albus]|uniref:tetratricopeptide repeat protein n=1 Tax=Streptomyces albus TaxID=1888 RepID=UPI0004C4DFC4|nr:tetratricopeptide repeat protein [Streptomyces albus]